MKRIAGIGLGLVTLLLLILWGLRVYQVNQRYPKESIHRVAYGDTQAIAENVCMEITGSEWIHFSEISGTSIGAELSEDGYYYMVSVQITNIGMEEAEADLTQLNVECNGYINGISMEEYLAMNDIMTMHPALAPGESIALVLPYVLYDFQWKRQDWAGVQERDYWLAQYTYPNKWCWDIPQE